MHDSMPYDPVQGRRPCSDFTDMLRRLINCRIIIIIIIIIIKVKVPIPLKLEIHQFSKSISSAIFNVSWQMTTDSETTEQYLTFVRSRFLIYVLVFCVT